MDENMNKSLSLDLLVASGKFDIEKEYWLAKLSGNLNISGFPPDSSRTHSNHYRKAIEAFSFPAEVYEKLVHMSRASELGIFIIVLAGLNFLLYRYTGNGDIIIGTPVFKQEVPGTYLNDTLALRSWVRMEMTFKDLLLQVKHTVSEANEYMNFPFTKIIDLLNLHGNLKGTRLFHTMVLLEDIHETPGIKNQECDTIFSLSIPGEYIECEIKYNAALYEARTINQLARCLVNCIKNITENPTSNLSEIEILSEEERHQVLYDFNGNMTDLPKNNTIDRLFEEQVEKSPDRIAVVSKSKNSDYNKHLTYRELNGSANRLAKILIKKGVKADKIVVIILEHSTEMITIVIAVLKAGGACFPMAPDTPMNRIKSMLDDSKASMLITNTSTIKNHSFTNLQGLRLTGLKPTLTGLRPNITDLDSLPTVDRSLINFEKYDPYIGDAMVKNTRVLMQATRGCPYNCTYCHKIWSKKHHVRSAENIFEEVNFYYQMGVKRFSFVDDIFNFNIKNSTRFFQLILQHDLKVHFLYPNGLRGDILTKEYIDLMAKAGVINFGLALETASPRLQKLIGKNLKLDKFRENIEYVCKNHPNIVLELFTMHGLPTETEEEAMMTLNYIKSLKWVHFPYINVLRIYSNTNLEKMALKHGISKKDIENSENLAYHELPHTLPFSKQFSLAYQGDFLNNYFLSRERLLHVLPHQLKLLTKFEIVQKYNSYLPININTFDDLLQFVKISEDELGAINYLDEDHMLVPGMNQKLHKNFPAIKPSADALKIFLLDVSKFFTTDRGNMLYDVVEQPMGLLYLLTYLKKRFESRIHGKIAVSRLDFDSYEELKTILKQFKPDLIGIRALTFFKDFFHKTITMIRNWGINAPIITGGPYATSGYTEILQNKDIDIAVLGEGEITFSQLVEKIIDNGGKLPGEDVLKGITGIAFIPKGKPLKKSYSRQIMLLDELISSGELDKVPGENVVKIARPFNIAFTFYTSGSSGKPKGVLQPHQGIINNIFTKINELEITPDDIFCHNLKISFAASVWQIFTPLFIGAPLLLYPEDIIINTYEFFKGVKIDKVSIVEVVPSVLKSYLELLESGKIPIDFKKIRKLVLTGEEVPPSLVNNFYEKYRVDLVNAYGQTEYTDDALYYKIPYNTETKVVPVGKPALNTQVYILNNDGNIQPRGVPGELYISGDGLARGYLNRPGLTAELFLPNPFIPGKFMFKTGDFARRLADAHITFLGRVDRQVKIRGFRVEVGEIESRLLNLHEIKEVVVMARIEKNGGSGDEGGEKYLCAYYVSEKEYSISELKNYLSGELPAYMIPSYFVHLKKIPLNPNGKVDRIALPLPGTRGVREGAAPSTTIQLKMVKIWAEVLNLDEKTIGIDENFADLGGHSLKATILANKMHKAFNIKIPLTEIFKTPTIRQLSYYLENAKKNEFFSIHAVEKKEFYRLSSVQKRIYFLCQLEPESANYDNPEVLVLEGNLNKAHLEDTVMKLPARHETLRTSFEIIKGEPVQRVQNDVDLKCQYYDVWNRSSEQEKQGIWTGGIVDGILKRFMKPFDLCKAPLFGFGLIRVEKEKHILVVNIHHIVFDGTSMAIFLKEFLELYKGEELPALRIHYKDYSEWQNKRMGKEAMAKQEKYWLEKFGTQGEMPVLKLQYDFKRPEIQSFEGNTLYFQVGKQETEKLKMLAKEQETTLYMVIFAIYNILLWKTSGNQDIIVGVPTAGRNHADLEPIVGMFVNTLALRNYPSGEKTFKNFLKEVKFNSLEAFENQDYHLEKLVEKVEVTKVPGRNPLFDTVFIFQNMDHTEIEIPGLKMKMFKHENPIAKFDLTLMGGEFKDLLTFLLEYCTKLFKRETAEWFIRDFKYIMSYVLDNPGKKLSEIVMIREEEEYEILTQFNDELENE